MGIYELINGKPEPPLTEEQIIEQQKAVKHWDYRITTPGICYSLDLFLGYPIAVTFDKKYSLKAQTFIFNNKRRTNEHTRHSTRRKTAN